MCRDKLEKYLHKFGEPYKESDSGSSYYKIGTTKIRISDHQSPFIDPGILNILFPQNSESIILIIGGKLAVMQNYNKLREYIRNFVLTAICTKPIKVTKIETKVIKEVVEPNEILDLHGLTGNQIQGLKKMINVFRKQNK